MVPKGQDRKILLEWYRIRDLWFGENHVCQNRLLALELAEHCEHPEAQWLCGKKIRDTNDHVIYLLEYIDYDCDITRKLVRIAVKAKNAFAQALWIDFPDVKNPFKYAELSALQGERDGFNSLGEIYYGKGDTEMAACLFLKAAKLGSKNGMSSLGRMYREECFGKYWMGKSTIEEDMYKFYYKNQLSVYRKMVDMWTLVAKRLGVIKDIRRLIGKMIWKQRKFIEAPKESAWNYLAHFFKRIKI